MQCGTIGNTYIKNMTRTEIQTASLMLPVGPCRRFNHKTSAVVGVNLYHLWIFEKKSVITRLNVLCSDKHILFCIIIISIITIRMCGLHSLLFMEGCICHFPFKYYFPNTEQEKPFLGVQE